ncbi:hypothetical protein [Henriciella sp.]|uniref:hypothetical protein n=1 Tax=Henriciella sp. TaxID=1968823 RepID=UPI00261B8FE2|nr:hypothetical protein [Henriciella sp.]
MRVPKTAIDTRMASALFAEAQAKGVTGFAGAVASRAMGGLWVGGNVWLTPEELVFRANAMNRRFHLDPKTLAWRIPLAEVENVSVCKAFVTRIIEISTGEETRSIRCFKASAFAAAIEATARKVRA